MARGRAVRSLGVPRASATGPARKKRSRSLLLGLIGLIAMAGVAVGLVVALPSGKPGHAPLTMPELAARWPSLSVRLIHARVIEGVSWAGFKFTATCKKSTGGNGMVAFGNVEVPGGSNNQSGTRAIEIWTVDAQGTIVSFGSPWVLPALPGTYQWGGSVPIPPRRTPPTACVVGGVDPHSSYTHPPGSGPGTSS